MEERLRELEGKEHALQEEQRRLWKEMEEIKEKVLEERLKTLGEQKDVYAKKLKRIKAYTDAFVAETAYELNGVLITRRNSNLRYGFRKHQEPYKDDFHEVMADPLDWMIAEYDLIGMEDYVEIRFDYYTEAVKDFVMQWMQETIPHAEYDEHLFAFRR